MTGVTLQTGAGLFGDLLPLGEGLVVKHVSMASLFENLWRKRIAHMIFSRASSSSWCATAERGSAAE